MTERVDFSGNAGVFDLRHGALLSDEAIQRLQEAAGLHARARVLDVGAGTGRVAIPLAEHGCHVVAVEPSTAMLAQLRAKAFSACVRGVVGAGLVIGYLWLRTESIWIVALAHGAFNNWGQYAFKYMQFVQAPDLVVVSAGSLAVMVVGAFLLSSGGARGSN